MKKVDSLERSLGPFLALCGIEATVDERQLDILKDRQVTDQIETLKDEPHFAITNARPFGSLE